ncbi:MAG: ribosome biogenesis GTPase Der [Myxococcota bacterium]
MNGSRALPVVALVGRPNVGKSTLFNRYAGYRRALVANEPGLTRDRIVERIEVAGRALWLVDTAGLDPAKGEGLDAAVQAQARSAVDEADVILFVVDGKTGLIAQDESIAQTLRRSGKPLALLVNKVDRPGQHADRVHEFFRLGIPHTYAVSAEHGSGAFDALEAILETLPHPEEGVPGATPPEEDAPLRITIVGRPNVGKSSIANRLAGEERVVVAATPGTTRDAVDIEIRRDGRDYVLVDTAGLRKVGRRQGPGEHGGALMTLRSLERADVALLVIDAAAGITDQDARVASLVREHGCAALVLANKWDLVAGEARSDALDGIRHGLRFMTDVPILTVSAQKGTGFGPLFKRIRQVVAAAGMRIPTSDLNRWLHDVAEKHPPAMAARGSSRRLNKLFYASQVGTRPPTVVVFCTDPDAIQTSYVRFLENQLRESFGFEGSPVRVRLRARGQRRGEGD